MDFNQKLEQLQREEKELKKQLEQNHNKMNDYCKKIAHYSTFNVKEIGEIIANIASIYEGDEFILHRAPYALKPNAMGAVIRIVRSSEMGGIYQKFQLSNLEAEGKIIILIDTGYEEITSIQTIAFYGYSNSSLNRLLPLVKLDYFPYIKEFIDNLISFKMDQDIDYLSENELKILAKEFISSKVEEIEDYHQKKYAQLEENIKQEIDSKKAYHKERLNNLLNG